MCPGFVDKSKMLLAGIPRKKSVVVNISLHLTFFFRILLMLVSFLISGFNSKAPD